MFKDITINLLGSSYANNSIKTVNGDFQNNNTTLEFEEYKYKCTRLLFIDYVEPLLAESSYINVNNRVYRIIKSEQYDEHMEIYLFLCDFKNIKVNRIDKKALILNIQDKINYEDDKIIIADFPIKTGDIVEYQNLKWFVISQIDTNISTLKARLRKVEQSFKIYIDNILKDVPSIFEVATQTIMESQKLNIVDGNIKALIQDSDITKKITYDNRVIKMGSAWKVNGFTSEHKGLRTVYLVKDVFNTNDDKENEIADRWIHEKKNEYIITSNNVELFIGATTKSDVNVIDKGVEVLTPKLTYSVLDSTIATVDDKGIITGIKEGNTTITGSFIGADFKTYTSIFTTTVTKVPVIHNYSIVADAEITLNIGAVKNVNAIAKDNGGAILNQVITYVSNNRGVGVVDTLGMVTGIADGTCNITSTFVGEDGLSYTCITKIIVKSVPIPVSATYKIENKDQMNDTSNSIKKYVTKTYICDKFENDVKVNGDYNITYIPSADLVLSKVEIDLTIKNEISIYNASSLVGSIEISFEDVITHTITKQTISLIR